MITIIAAVSKNGVIGNNNKLPWHLAGDFSFFKEVTMGKPIIMGRKTYDSIGKPLPGRHNIVVSKKCRDISLVQVVPSLDEAFTVAGHTRCDEIMVIGGAEIYKQAMPLADKMYITHVDVKLDGDARFPEIGREWKETSKRMFEKGENDDYDYSIVTYFKQK